ncbi:hypothetical protein Q3G72_013762 [Acer saccharum]|nr:hypothetical protein Q3G72_013762 [Acer saccharum]
MAGLVCALNLDKRGVKSTVFDTGIHGLGGRMGTRIIDPQPLIFDHAAQFFTENIPNATAEKVKTGMFGGIEAALGLSKGSLPRPFYSRLQLWGAALPINTPGVPCIFDPHGRAGICGDWLLGSSVESAAVSGMALANHIAEYIQSGGVDPEEFAVGHEYLRSSIKQHILGTRDSYWSSR